MHTCLEVSPHQAKRDEIFHLLPSTVFKQNHTLTLNTIPTLTLNLSLILNLTLIWHLSLR